MKKIFLIFGIVIWITTTLEIAWLWPIPSILLSFHAIFIAVATVTFVSRWEYAAWYAVVQGFLLDLYSAQIFGLYMVASVLLVFLITILQETWLKQASLLSVATISALSLALIQLLVLGWQWLSERFQLLRIVLIEHATISGTLLGWLAMILCTIIMVRLISPRYEKLI